MAGAMRYRVYVSKTRRLLIEAAFDTEGQAFGYARDIKDKYPVVCVRSVVAETGGLETEEDILMLRGGQEVPLKGQQPEAPPAKPAPVVEVPAPKPKGRIWANMLTLLLLLCVVLVVLHTSVIPLWG